MTPRSLPVVGKRAPTPGPAWPWSAISGYAVAVLVFAAAFAAVALLGHLLDAAPPVSLFLCAIIFVAWFAGLGPALLVCALSVLAFGYFYLLPLNSLTLASRDLPRIILFGIASLFIAAALDLPLDRRGARRPDLGREPRRRGCHLRLHAARSRAGGGRRRGRSGASGALRTR